MARASSRVDGVRVSGPLAAFVDAYAAELTARGYRPLSVVNELRQVGRLSGWLAAQGLSAADLERRAGGGVLGVAAGRGAVSLAVVAAGAAGLVGRAARPGGRRRGACRGAVGVGRAAWRRLPAICAASGVLPRARSRATRGMRACSWTASGTGGLAGIGRQRRDRALWRDRAVGGLVGQRDAVLRVGAAGVSAVLLRRRAGRGGSVAGGALCVRAARRRRCRRRSPRARPGRCWSRVIGAARWAGATTR